MTKTTHRPPYIIQLSQHKQIQSFVKKRMHWCQIGQCFTLKNDNIVVHCFKYQDVWYTCKKVRQDVAVKTVTYMSTKCLP